MMLLLLLNDLMMTTTPPGTSRFVLFLANKSLDDVMATDSLQQFYNLARTDK